MGKAAKDGKNLSVQGLEVLSELSDAVPLADLDAEALLVCNIGGQAAETLAATASYPHQQGIAARLHQDSVDAAHMKNGIPATRPSYSALDWLTHHTSLIALCAS